MGHNLIEFRILGPLEVLEHDRALALGGPKVRALLAVLLLHRGEVVSSDRLIDALWGERASATAPKTVQVYVSNLRKALGAGLLITRGHGYLLPIEAGQIDSDRFQALVAEGRRALEAGDGRQAAERLRGALAMWRGPALADFAYAPFAQNAIARLEEARLEALEDRIDADLMTGEQAGLVGELEALVNEHPSRERFQGQLMLALYRSGRQAEALERYRKARGSLVEELGLEPGRALQELERAILAQDPALEPSAGGPRPPPAAAARRARRGGWLIVAAGVVLLAAIVAAVVKLSGSGAGSVRVPANSVAAIDPRTNSVVGWAPAGSRPGAIAFGSGSLWVANVDDQTVVRIDPGSSRMLHTFSVGGPPTGLAAGGGAIWVAQANPQASSVFVTAIDPQFDHVGATKRIGNIVRGGPAAVTAQGATVWVAPSSGLLTRLDSATGHVDSFDPNSGPAAIALGAGAVWLTDTEGNNVTRVDPTTGLLTPIPVGNGPTGIAVGEGGVWVAYSLEDKIARIDPATPSVTDTIPVGHSPASVAVGAGSVWVADSGDGTVTRIDPRTKKVQARIPVGGSPQAITIADGHVWVTVDAQTIKPTRLASGGGTLRIESQLDVSSIDPARGGLFQYGACANLLNYTDQSGPAGSRLIPEVAKALPALSADRRTYTFAIRNGFRFSPPSNEAVTAQTFKTTIERSLNPRMHSGDARAFSDIAGAAAYTAGKASHISGIAVRGETLKIRLLAPAPDFPASVTQPIVCAVPSNTPIDLKGLGTLPSAGPYYVKSFTPGQGVLLARNPNYRGSRPHRFAHIELAVKIPYQRAVADVQAGTADYTSLVSQSAGNAAALFSHLSARYGPGSSAAKYGAQQYFVNPQLELDYFDLNTHRPLFSDVRMRQAVNYAVDRHTLAQLGDGFSALPDHPVDHYLPPGMPGYRAEQIYPLTPDLRKARALAQGKGGTAILYTCDLSGCLQQAHVLRRDLAAIGLQMQIKAFPVDTMFARIPRPGEPFDIAFFGWQANYADPVQMLTRMLADSTVNPTFNDPAYQRKLAATAQLTGPRRYLTYSKLDIDLARNAAPLIAFGNSSSSDFFSARVGCQTYGPFGIDLAALCIKPNTR
jgi:YVTN family beta-propeller protein